MEQQGGLPQIEVRIVEVSSELPPTLERMLRGEDLDWYRSKMSMSLEDEFVHTAQQVTQGKPMREGGQQVDYLSDRLDALVRTNVHILLDPERAEEVVGEVLAAYFELDDRVPPTALGWAFLQIGPEGVGRFVEDYQGEELWFAVCEHCNRYHLMTNAARMEQDQRREEQRLAVEAMRARLEAEAAKGPGGIFAIPVLGPLLLALLGPPEHPAMPEPDSSTEGNQLPTTCADQAAEPTAASSGEQPSPGDVPSDG